MELLRQGRKVGTGRHGRHARGTRHPRSKRWRVLVLQDLRTKEYVLDPTTYNSFGEIAEVYGLTYFGVSQMRLRWKVRGDDSYPLLRIQEA
jgi:hypothetical protein